MDFSSTEEEKEKMRTEVEMSLGQSGLDGQDDSNLFCHQGTPNDSLCLDRTGRRRQLVVDTM